MIYPTMREITKSTERWEGTESGDRRKMGWGGDRGGGILGDGIQFFKGRVGIQMMGVGKETLSFIIYK